MRSDFRASDKSLTGSRLTGELESWDSLNYGSLVVNFQRLFGQYLTSRLNRTRFVEVRYSDVWLDRGWLSEAARVSLARIYELVCISDSYDRHTAVPPISWYTTLTSWGGDNDRQESSWTIAKRNIVHVNELIRMSKLQSRTYSR